MVTNTGFWAISPHGVKLFFSDADLLTRDSPSARFVDLHDTTRADPNGGHRVVAQVPSDWVICKHLPGSAR